MNLIQPTSFQTIMLKTPIGRLRLLSLIDALSYIYLLYCAIYLKRMLGDAEAIRTPGMAHGVFFTVYCVTLLNVVIAKALSFRAAVLVGMTSLIPLAPFFVDKWLKKQEVLKSK